MAILEDFGRLNPAVAVDHGAAGLRGANVGYQVHAAILTRIGGMCRCLATLRWDINMIRLAARATKSRGTIPPD